MNTSYSIRATPDLNRDIASTGVDGCFGILNLAVNKVNSPSRGFFVYIDAKTNKITSHKTYEGNSVYKEFNNFINNTLAGMKGLNKPSIVHVPWRFIPQKTIDIWGSHDIEIIGFKADTTPELLRLFIATARYSNLTSKTTDVEFKDIINRVNNILNDLKLKRTIKVYQTRLGKVTGIIKRCYSTIISLPNLSRKKLVYTPAKGIEDTCLSLKTKGDFEYLEHQYEDMKKQMPKNTWFKSDPYKYKSLGNMNIKNVLRDELIKVFESFEDYGPHAILFLIDVGDGSIKTLDKQFLVNKHTDVDNIIIRIYERVELLLLRYNIKGDVNCIMCKYRRLHIKTSVNWEETIKGKEDPKAVVLDTKSNLTKQESKYLSPNYIPYSMVLSKYGDLIFNDPLLNISLYNYNGLLLRVKIHEDGHHTIQTLDKNLKITSEVSDEDFGDYFIRSVNNGKSCTYLKISHNTSKLLNKEYEIKSTFLEPKAKEITHDLNILTFDIETYTEGQELIPYACGFYDGEKCYRFYLTNYDDPNAMLIDCIQSMLLPKYFGYTVYVHNLGKFDVLFILRLVYNKFRVEKLLAIDKDIISLTVYGPKIRGRNITKLVFRDSLRLLPSSLRSLGDSFNVKVTKGIFPYNFVNKDNLKYKGEIPNIRYYNQDCETLKKYNILLSKNKVWDLKYETLKYLERDLISLHQIMIKMSQEVFDLYSINITKCSTISALSLVLYKSNFLKSSKLLSRSKGDVECAIREAYYGGAVDVYIPYGNNLYYYDANSLYPGEMLNPLPVGKPTHSLNQNLNELFGYIKATVTTPDNNYAPILPYKLKTKDGSRLVFPNGTWTAWFFSEELKHAVNFHGYKVEVHESYLYNKGHNIFTEYIEKIGAIKQTSTGVRRQIHKLLLNSLYGRTGMSSDRDITNVVSPEKAQFLLSSHHVVDNFVLTEGKEYIRYKSKPSKDLCAESGMNYNELLLKYDESTSHVDSSPAIAAAVTAYARVKMNPLKSIHGNTFYYGDTDSAILSQPLPDSLIGNKIGQFKLEFPLIKTGYFISPKLYCLELDDGRFIQKSKGNSSTLSLSDYLELYNGGFLKTMNKRWKTNLSLGSVRIADHPMTISSSFTKRNKVFSLGIWVDTSPIYINPNGCIVPLDLIKYVTPKGFIYLLPSPKEYLLLMKPTQTVILLPCPIPRVLYINPTLPNIIYLTPPQSPSL